MPEALRLLLDQLETPIGVLEIASDDEGRLRAMDWKEFRERMRRSLDLRYGRNAWSFAEASDPFGHTTSLAAYMDGDLAAIDSLRVETHGTQFQRAVWSALRTIPVGAPVSYGALARTIGRPTAVRAVGLANGSNPIAIVVPCHRVIGADGSLTGYGGGLKRKQWLLRHEASAVQRRLFGEVAS